MNHLCPEIIQSGVTVIQEDNAVIAFSCSYTVYYIFTWMHVNFTSDIYRQS